MTNQFFIAQLEKQYILYLKNIILGTPFQPIMLRGGKNKPGTMAELFEQVKLFQANEKKGNNKGWIVKWEAWVSKKFGKQQWPSTICVNTEEDFLFLIKKEKEAVAFKEQLHQLLQWNELICTWLANRPAIVLELNKSWAGICAVVDYLLQHDVRHHFLRSLPVPVHTKFIEQHKRVIHAILHYLNRSKFPALDVDLEEALLLTRKPFLFTLRWLDESLSTRYSAGMNLFAVPVEYLQQQQWDIERVILVENATNLYMFPAIKGALVICSYGKALHLLKEIPFFHRSRLFYWGDMDEKGFEMLNDIRSYYLHTKSLFMDEATLVHHQADLGINSIAYQNKVFPLLLPYERKAYEMLLPNNQWLEQERLHQLYVQGILINFA